MKKKLASALLVATLIATTVPVTTQAEVTYEEQDSGTNMGQSFTGSATVTFGQTPSFTVKIPKTITLDEEGVGKYTVGVKGEIPSKYTVSVVPDETIVVEEENNLLDSITADVTAGKTKWTATELNPDSYAENEENTIQMQSIDYGKFEGTLNFNVSAKMPVSVELKDASDEIKEANNFKGSFGASSMDIVSSWVVVSDVSVGDVVYCIGGTKSNSSQSWTIEEGYYRALKLVSGAMVVSSASGTIDTYTEYLGTSYVVEE